MTIKYSEGMTPEQEKALLDEVNALDEACVRAAEHVTGTCACGEKIRGVCWECGEAQCALCCEACEDANAEYADWERKAALNRGRP